MDDSTVYGVMLEVALRELAAAGDRLRVAEDNLTAAIDAASAAREAVVSLADVCEQAARAYARAKEAA